MTGTPKKAFPVEESCIKNLIKCLKNDINRILPIDRRLKMVISKLAWRGSSGAVRALALLPTNSSSGGGSSCFVKV